MRAIAIQEFGGRDKLQLLDLPIPPVGPRDVRIRVKAAGVNPVDWKIREGFLRDVLPHEFPIILGWDVAGVIDKIGIETPTHLIGDEVYAYCRLPLIHQGSYAEYITLPADMVAKKSRSLSFEQAASIPLAALTAYQSLFDAGGLESGQTVLIHAAAGGVGGFAVQLAKHRGATVIGTASSQNHDYIRGLGADRVIDYTTQDFRQVIREWYPSGIDLVYDCVGGQVLEQSMEILNTAGRLVTIVEPAQAEIMKGRGLNVQFVFVAPNHRQLVELTRMADQGQLQTHVSGTFPLEKAVQAHEILEAHHVKGKLVLTVGT
jgi:NADPH:quinone reductase-like Zn-dependent oxidoreductase